MPGCSKGQNRSYLEVAGDRAGGTAPVSTPLRVPSSTTYLANISAVSAEQISQVGSNRAELILEVIDSSNPFGLQLVRDSMITAGNFRDVFGD